MKQSAVARKLREQIHYFSGILYPRFSKPKARFIAEMIYGREASQDVKLSRIARSLGEEILLKKTEERLSYRVWLPASEVTRQRGAAFPGRGKRNRRRGADVSNERHSEEESAICLVRREQ
jgi:hypothetical protein